MTKLTDKTIFTAELADNDFVHGVDVSDTSQDVAGSSYKVPIYKIRQIRVTRTVFVDYAYGTTAANGALVERMDRPFNTKAEALAKAKLLLSPTSTDRVLISVAMGFSSQPIVYLSNTDGVDWDLNGGSINTIGVNGAIDDGGFNVDTVIYNANKITSSAFGVFQTGSGSNTTINAKRIKSVFCTGGTQIINSTIENTDELASNEANGSCTQTVNGDIILNVTTNLGFGFTVNSCGTNSYQKINGDIIVNSIGGGAGGSFINRCFDGIQIINGNQYFTGAITKLSGSSIEGNGSSTIDGDIICSSFAGSVALANDSGTGTVTIKSGSRLKSGAANAITKTSGILILQGGVSLISTTNSIAGTAGQKVKVHGTVVEKYAPSLVGVYEIGTVITNVLVN